MEWERGDVTPGRAIANLKTSGLRELLEALAAEKPAPADSSAGDEGVHSWTPVV
jgi:hypothetical protein